MTAALEAPPDQERTVAALSAKLHVPIDEVSALYEQQRAGLAARARVTTFLHIVAIRNVQEILRKRAHGEQLLPHGAPSQLAV